ncbi:fibronectin type III domain-containing protein [Longivirga aurantiaca]|uniref:Fibronectin type III domain-containing protein n=1 Tax=Longivirga aurantiaca TaxID=1837743 RepID=A0ABW1SZC6_9ACTN
MNRTARRAAAAGVTAAAILGSTLAVAPSASAATPCQTDCISAITATPYPDGLRLDVSTSSPTLVSADIYFGATKVKSFAPAAGSALTSTRSYDMQTGLSQGAWYRYVVKAADSFGNVRTEEGTLRTPRRDLTVTFDKVSLTNDSDSTGAGDFYWMGSKVSTSELGAYRQLGATSTYWAWSTGGTYSVPSTARTHSIAGAQQNRPLRFVMWDDDNDVFGGGYICLSGLPTCVPSFTNGSDDTADWSTAAGTLALPTKTGVSSGAFSIATPGGTAVGYSVSGTWSQTVRNITTPVRSLAATPYNGKVLLTWAPPASTNGAPVLGYRVTSDKGLALNLPANAASFTATGLTNGVVQKFSVVAVNSEGDSLPTSISAAAKAVPGAVSGLTAKAGNATVNATWVAAPAGEGATSYRVYVNGVQKKIVTTTSAAVTATNGASATVKVVPFNALGDGPASFAAAVTPYAPSSISGWASTSLTAASGGTFSSTVAVTCGSQSGRPAVLQRRLQGATSWYTVTTQTTNVGCSIPFTGSVLVGIWEWRVYAPAWKTYGPVGSAVRTVSAKTTVSGFDTTTSTVAAGWTYLDGISVTPGNQRTVWVIARKVGTTGSYSNLWQGTAQTTGAITAKIVVQPGTWEYRVYVPANYMHGQDTMTAPRIITGT